MPYVDLRSALITSLTVIDVPRSAKLSSPSTPELVFGIRPYHAPTPFSQSFVAGEFQRRLYLLSITAAPAADKVVEAEKRQQWQRTKAISFPSTP